MFEEVRIRKRKSVKYGKTYEYRFETAPVGGERKWLSKGGFLTEEEAKEAGIEAWKRYCLCGLSERPSDISYADFLDEWMEKECKYNLKETTLLNYRKRIRIHIKPELGNYQVRRLSRDRLQKFLQDKYNDGYSKNTLSTLRGIVSKSMNYAVNCGLISMLILEKLWKGDVAPGERCHISKGEYSKSYAAMVDSEEYLRKHLTGEALQQFQQFRDAELNLSRLSNFNSFAEGFRLGALLMLDVFGCGEVPKDRSS